MTSFQKLICSGDLQVVNAYDPATQSNQGRISFVDTYGTQQGQIRSFNSGFNQSIIVDCSGMPQGVNFRTDTDQGPTDIGGTGKEYVCYIDALGLQAKYITIVPWTDDQFGRPVINALRESTAYSGSSHTFMEMLKQRSFSYGENISCSIGGESGFSATSGFCATTGDPTFPDCVGYLGMYENMFNIHIKAIVWNSAGHVICQNDLTTLGTLTVNDTLIKASTGDPEGVETASIGSLFMRKDGSAGTTLYTKESGTGNTGWVAVGGGSIRTLYSSGVKNSPLVPSGTANGTFWVDTTQSIGVGVYTISLNAWMRKPSTTVVTNGSVLAFGYSIGTGTAGVGAGIRNGGLVAGLSSDYEPYTVQMISFVGTSHYLWGTLTSIFTITATTNLRIGWQQRLPIPTASTPAGTFTVEYDYVLEKLN